MIKYYLEESEVAEKIGQEQVYIVKQGDNLYRIGLRFGVHWRVLAEHIKLQNPSLIYPNQQILIPAS